MASKGINVKIERTKLIFELTKVISGMEDAMTLYEVDLKDYEFKHKKWLENVGKQVLKTKPEKVHVGSRWDNNKYVELSWNILQDNLPKEPEQPEKPYKYSGYGRNYVGGFDERKAEILNAIRILEMSDDEFVNASTYGAVSKYL